MFFKLNESFRVFFLLTEVGMENIFRNDLSDSHPLHPLFPSLTGFGCLSASALLLAPFLNNLTRGKMDQHKLCNTVCREHIYSRSCSRNRKLTDVEAQTFAIARMLYLMEKKKK